MLNAGDLSINSCQNAQCRGFEHKSMQECRNELRDLEIATKYYDIERLETDWNRRIDVNHSHENAESI